MLQTPKTYRELIERFPFGQWQLQIANVKFDGRSLGDMRVELATAHPFETRFSDSFTERIVTATMSVALGLPGEFNSQNLVEPKTHGLRPDFAYFENGRLRFFLETSVASSPEEAAHRDVSAEISAYLNAAVLELRLNDALPRVFVQFVLPWGTLDFPRKELAEEMIRAASDLAASERSEILLELVPKTYSLLSSLGARVYLKRETSGYIGVSFGAHAFDPNWYLNAFAKIVRSKSEQYKSLRQVHPVRLFVYFVDLVSNSIDTPFLARIASDTQTPFEQIYVGYQNVAEPLLQERDAS